MQDRSTEEEEYENTDGPYPDRNGLFCFVGTVGMSLSIRGIGILFMTGRCGGVLGV